MENGLGLPMKSRDVPAMEKEVNKQDIQFFVKSSAFELFGMLGVPSSTESWVGRNACLPELHKENSSAEEILRQGFRGFVWLHEQGKGGESGRGLTAVAKFGPMRADRGASVLEAVFFEHTVGKDLLDKHKNDGTFISSIGASRHSRIWPISDGDVDFLLSAVQEKIRKIAEYEKAMGFDHPR